MLQEITELSVRQGGEGVTALWGSAAVEERGRKQKWVEAKSQIGSRKATSVSITPMSLVCLQQAVTL